MRNIIIFHDTVSHLFIIDRTHPQAIKDCLKGLKETNVEYPGLERKAKAAYFGSGTGRINIVRVSGKGGHLDKSVDTIIASLVDSGNIELELQNSEMTFYEFIRRAHDLPRFISVTKASDLPPGTVERLTNLNDDDDDGSSDDKVVMVTSDGTIADNKTSYLFRFGTCELHFEIGRVTVRCDDASVTHEIDTHSVDMVNVVVPLCLQFAMKI